MPLMGYCFRPYWQRSRNRRTEEYYESWVIDNNIGVQVNTNVCQLAIHPQSRLQEQSAGKNYLFKAMDR